MADLDMSDVTVESTGDQFAGTTQPPVQESTPPQSDPPAEVPTPPEDEPSDEPPPTAAQSPESERNPDGTFKPKKPRDDPKARVEQAVARQREAERRAEAAEQRARDLETRQAPPRAEQPPAKQETAQQAWQRFKSLPEAPKEENFENYADFTFAAMTFVGEQIANERDHRNQQRAQVTAFEQHRDRQAYAFSERLDAAVKANPQFLETLSEDVLNLRPTVALQRDEQGRLLERRTVFNAIADEIFESPNSTALMRHLSDHPEEFQRLATLPPRELTRQMAMLEARATAVTTGPASTPGLSQAKPPIKPVGSAPPAVEDVGSDDEPLDVFVRRENAKLRRGPR